MTPHFDVETPKIPPAHLNAETLTPDESSDTMSPPHSYAPDAESMGSESSFEDEDEDEDDATESVDDERSSIDDIYGDEDPEANAESAFDDVLKAQERVDS